MFWIEDASRLRNLKKAIGSKLIFKFRLDFITDLNLHLKFEKRQSMKFSTVETEMVTKMRLSNTSSPRSTFSGQPPTNIQ